MARALASPGLVPDAKFIQNSVKYRFTWFASNCKPGGDIPRCMNVELLLRALCCDLTCVLQEREESTEMLQEDVLLIRAVSASYNVWASCKMTMGWLSGITESQNF